MNISLAAEPLFYLGGLPITNSLLTAWIVVAALLLLSRAVARRATLAPRGLANAAEAVVEQMLNFADGVTGSRAESLRFFPVVGAIFFFVLGANWIGLLPGVGSVGFNELVAGEREFVPFFRAASADLNTTLALAILSVAISHFYGMRSVGLLKYWGKFFVAPWRPPYVVGTFVGLLEFVSEFAKVISFSFRLFGNIFAGEVLLLVIGFLAPYLAPVPFLFMEIFVGFIQALVFAMLSLVFFKIATTAHEGGEGHAPAAA